jgi:hypothetical protein
MRRAGHPAGLEQGDGQMSGVNVKMVGSKLVVEVDILKAIAEGVGGSRPVSTVKPGPKPGPQPSISSSSPS